MLHEYRVWRRNDGDLAPASEKTQMDTIRVFVRWCESIDAVVRDLSTKVQSPTLTGGDNVRDVMLEEERAERVLTHLAKYEFASLRHVGLSLLWHSMMRIGAAHALDIDDYHPRDQYVEVRHRPDQGTPIKNKKDGERLVALSDEMCDLLDDWVAQTRFDRSDSYGREPLLTTRQGRVSKSTLRSYCYRATRPCEYGETCPHDRDPEDCEATSRDHAAKCPSSVSPHAVRRGGITRSLSKDVPQKIVSDRANVSLEVLEKHYDQRTEREKMEQRRGYLENL
jgi:integrase